MQTSLGKGKRIFAFILFSSPHPLLPVGPFLLHHPVPGVDQQLQRSPSSACTVVLHTAGGISGDGSQWLEQTLPGRLGPEEIPPVSSILLWFSLARPSGNAVKLQFPWLVFIFLLVKSAVTPGRAVLPLGA